MSLVRSVLLAASGNRWLERQARRRRFVRRAVRRFMPGEEASHAVEAARALTPKGIAAALTCLGENVASPGEAAEVADHYVALVQDLDGFDAHVSVKLTHLGLDLGPEVAWEGLSRIAVAARDRGGFLWVDMESSPYVDPTLTLCRRAQEACGPIGVCLQAYLHRTPRDMEALLGIGARIRLVKGAYREPPEVAIRGRERISETFLRLADTLLFDGRGSPGVVHGIGTHDMELIRRFQIRAREIDASPTDFEFQMLYGIRSPDQERLARDGYRVRTLISYGSSWYPWYMRRLAERPSNLRFLLRSPG